MRPRGILLRSAVALAGLPLAIATAPAGAGDEAAGPPAARATELLKLLHRDCGACHGMRLTGGLGPPLTPGALRDKPADALVATIVHGRNGTPMPPWGRFMSEAEARWLVARLQEGDSDAR